VGYTKNANYQGYNNLSDLSVQGRKNWTVRALAAHQSNTKMPLAQEKYA
jgi:hypothetical protein